MKIGIIAKPNTKGQFVIPYSYRKKFGIVPGTRINVIVQDDGIMLYPLNEAHQLETEIVSGIPYEKVLVATKGAWSKGRDIGKSKRENKRKLELAASLKRKKLW